MMMAQPLMNRQQASSAYPLQTPSPLDSLVRSSSARKPLSNTPSQSYSNRRQYHDPQEFAQQAPSSYNTPSSLTPGQSPSRQRIQYAPPSPLLHSTFARDSTATASSKDNNSYLDLSRDSIDAKNVHEDVDYYYYDADSVYSNHEAPPALRDSWQSESTVRHHYSNVYEAPPTIETGPNDSEDRPPSPDYHVPTLIVSSPETGEAQRYSSHAGKAPIVRPITSNFSRPVRPVSAEPPDTPSDTARRPPSPQPSTYSSSSFILPDGPAYGNTYPQSQPQSQPQPRLQPQLEPRPQLQPPPQPQRNMSEPSMTRRVPSPAPEVQRSLSSNAYIPQNPIPSRSNSSVVARTPGAVALPRRPPSLRTGSPTSVYSAYSFYQLDTPSPTGSTHFKTGPSNPSPSPSPRHITFQPTPPRSPAGNSPLSNSPQTPQEYLQLGIQHHEANRLRESAVCFEKSAKEGGGCGVGMLMWGLSLRHGWGCTKDEKSGFKWLRKAAEAAVEDLESSRLKGGGDMDSKAVQTELILSIYEVGQCFFHGWGVAKDQKMAVSYYTVAARLGDPDAQGDLGFCLANGKGCKKDRKAAAKWYRAAVAQGQSDIGLAWIYKEKLQ